jgi:site-specific recombinase XerD
MTDDKRPANVYNGIPIRPLAEIQVPEHLSGRNGVNRAPLAGLQLGANTDYEAAQCFFAEYENSPGTLRLYQREVERLFLWAWAECGKPVSSLNRQDFEGYLNFLVDPQPVEVWCGTKARRETDDWRPFELHKAPETPAPPPRTGAKTGKSVKAPEADSKPRPQGGMQERALKASVAAVNSLMQYLVDGGYLNGNPLGLIRQKRRKLQTEASASKGWSEEKSVERFLDSDMWDAVTATIEAMPRETPRELDQYHRLKFILTLLYVLAPRASELEAHRMNSFKEEHGRWWWHVVGKGNKAARVPVPDDMMSALVCYRQHLGLSPVPGPDDDTPLLVSMRNGSPIGARQLHNILKDVFTRAADSMPALLAHKAEKLRQASTHWGRHTGITAKVNAGMSARYVQKDARHSDARTTAMYTHEEDAVWHEESQKQHVPWKQSS